ncbi:MAG: lysophospholipase L1-like esterase [Myxococcota bacterium]
MAVSLPKRVGFSAVILLGLLTVMEVAGRLLPIPEVPIVLPSHPQRGWTLPVDSTFEFAGIPATSNSLGMRSPEPQPDATLRMLVLGDSTVFGHGVFDGHPFASLLAQRTGADVQNAGVPGYTCRQSAHRYREVIEHFTPDILIVYSMHNDARIIRSDEGWLGAAVAHPIGIVRLLSVGATWVRIRRQISRMSTGEFRSCLKGLIAEQRDHGGKTLLLTPTSDVAFATDVDLEAMAGVGPYYAVIRGVAEETNTVHLDMTDMRWTKKKSRSELMLDEVHPTSLGHRFIARWIHAGLLSSGMMEGEAPKDIPKPGTRNSPF